MCLFLGKHDPVILTGSNFFDFVLDSRSSWMVAFIAPVQFLFQKQKLNESKKKIAKHNKQKKKTLIQFHVSVYYILFFFCCFFFCVCFSGVVIVNR